MASPPPIVPARPARPSKNSPSLDRNTSRSPEKSIREPPLLPPTRPARRPGRPISVSPMRNSYTPSPLNELPDATPNPVEAPNPGVNIPSVGQEGQEFEEALERQNSNSAANEPGPEPESEPEAQHIHAPRPSRPQLFSDVNSNDSSLPHALPPTVTSSSTPNHEGGTRVPMYPNAGDVQAPSPSLSRSKQADPSLPPGSYGLHGHNADSRSPFEQAWYKKHPEELAREKMAARPDRALSSEELNQLVKNSTRQAGLATASNYVGTPDEETGYLATDELASRMVTPHAPGDKEEPTEDSRQSPGPHDHDHEDVNIHINDPIHQLHHIDGYAPANEVPEENEEQNAAEEGHDEYPIIAEDEAGPSSVHMPPAVSPTIRPHDYSHAPSHAASHAPSRTGSRPTSRHDLAGGNRPVIIHPPSRPVSPEEKKQYEPLFKDDDKAREEPSIDRFKRPLEGEANRFPSQDVWEDSPENMEAVQKRPNMDENFSPFETPEQEAQRRNQQPDPDMVQEEKSMAPTPNLPVEEIREHRQSPPVIDSPKPPGSVDTSQQRFPSRDIWEDAPDSSQLVTTVSIPEDEPNKDEPTKPAATGTSRPAIPARPSRRPKSFMRAGSDASEQTASIASPTSPPPQEWSTSPENVGDQETAPMKPTIPTRPKPHVPSRPSRSFNSQSDDGSAAGTLPSSAPQPKPKPPPRSLGSKIAALQSSLNLSDRLKIGPKAPPKPKTLQSTEEENGEKQEEEKKPLSDMRKSRARGPTRKAPSKPKDTVPEKAGPTLQIAPAWEIFAIDAEGNLSVNETSHKLGGAAEGTKEKGDEGVDLQRTESGTIGASAIQETHHEVPLEKTQSQESVSKEADSKRQSQSSEVKSEDDRAAEEVEKESSRRSSEKLPARSDIDLDVVSGDIVEAKDSNESSLLSRSVSLDSDDAGTRNSAQGQATPSQPSQDSKSPDAEKETTPPTREKDVHPFPHELPQAHLPAGANEETTEDELGLLQ